MAKQKEPFNPFYVLLVLLGIAFSITACAYGVMAWRDMRVPELSEAADSSLLDFMRQHGATLMGVELALLAVATFGAMGTDRVRQRRADANRPSRDTSPADTPPRESSFAETDRHDEQAGR